MKILKISEREITANEKSVVDNVVEKYKMEGGSSPETYALAALSELVSMLLQEIELAAQGNRLSEYASEILGIKEKLDILAAAVDNTSFNEPESII